MLVQPQGPRDAIADPRGAVPKGASAQPGEVQALVLSGGGAKG